jgi:hypothetical protein
VGYIKGILHPIDVTIKKKHERNLNEKEKYRRIIANMNLGLLEVDKRKNYAFKSKFL